MYIYNLYCLFGIRRGGSREFIVYTVDDSIDCLLGCVGDDDEDDDDHDDAI